MKDDDSSRGWELEDNDEAEDRWVLEDSEQQLGDEWDLEGTPEPVGQWQPVEYDKPSRGGPAWILPTLVTIALLAVLGYSAFTLGPELVERAMGLITGEEPAPPSESPPAEDAAAVAGEPTEQAAPTEEPTLTPVPSDTPTEEPPTTTPSPTLAVAQKVFATVVSEYGVNARSGPGTEFEVLQILEQDESFLVVDRTDGWLRLFVSEGPLEENQPVSGFDAYASADFLVEGARPFSEELWLRVLDELGITPTATPAPPTPVVQATVDLTLPTVTPIPPEAGEAVTETTTVPEGEAVTGTITDTVDTGEDEEVTVLIDAPNGLNVRTAPELNADVVTLLPDQSAVPAIGRYATNEWILVDLGDGATGWVFTELVQLEGELASLPAITLGELGPPTATPTETPTPEPTPIAPPVEPPDPYTSELPAGVPGAVVFSAAGVNARTAPAADSDVITILPENAALPVVGQSANGEWLQVELPQGENAWVFRATIIPRGNVNDVPVTDGTAEDAPPLPAPEPADEPTEVPAEAPAEAPTAAPEATEEPAVEATPEAAEEATEEAEPPDVAATASMRNIVVPVFGSPSAEGERIVQYGRGTVIPATGRTADGEWVQVLTTIGDTGWVAAKSVQVSVDLDSLPVVQ